MPLRLDPATRQREFDRELVGRDDLFSVPSRDHRLPRESRNCQLIARLRRFNDVRSGAMTRRLTGVLLLSGARRSARTDDDAGTSLLRRET